ncbi:CHC2 zinc finger domain-containing protein [Nitrosomonas ureae]|uniref:CHC2-type zinc finger protein n=1 Tax=Nitrosomonas ureae TaxID=44577 RepID=A0A2T5IRN0_9PROT|nr:CHC2 zinc finger domain-containing protein [Nitrosomonas ureae]PTQ86476.1 CHC2-type zinc finger protein [Nitrosomonas ureae]
MKSFVRTPQNIKSNISPVDFFRAELSTMQSPRGNGWCNGGICPFHSDKRAGSFRVNLETGAFICYSCGTKGRDIIAFIQKRDGLSFTEAVQKLTNEWGL